MYATTVKASQYVSKSHSRGQITTCEALTVLLCSQTAVQYTRSVHLMHQRSIAGLLVLVCQQLLRCEHVHIVWSAGTQW